MSESCRDCEHYDRDTHECEFGRGWRGTDAAECRSYRNGRVQRIRDLEHALAEEQGRAAGLARRLAEALPVLQELTGVFQPATEGELSELAQLDANAHAAWKLSIREDLAHASRCSAAWKALAKRERARLRIERAAAHRAERERDEARREVFRGASLYGVDEVGERVTREWGGAAEAKRLFPEEGKKDGQPAS